MRIKELQNKYGTTMRTLHEAYGIDFMSPYYEIEHNGKFTVNSLINKLKEHGYSPADSLILALVKGCNGWDSDDWNVVEIAPSADIIIDVPNCLSKYIRKYDFNDARKSEDCHAIFFAQKRTYLKGAVFSYHSYSKCYYHDISEVDYHRRFKDENAVPRGRFYDREIDKSGYCLDVYRSDLHSRVEKYKAEKAKNAYLQTDNADKVATLERLISEYKVKLSKALLNASTSDDVREIDRLMGWGGLSDIINTYETFKKKTEERSYSSIDASNADYDYVAKKCYAYLN